MEVFTDYVVLFILGLIFLPRITLLFLGMIAPAAWLLILGFFFAPRITAVYLITNELWASSPVLVVIMWIFAIIIDIVKLVMNIGMMSTMQKQYLDQYKNILAQRVF